MSNFSKFLKYLALFYFLNFAGVFGVELTFELPDNARECFYQEIGKNVSATLEFQVILTKIYL